jgi:hypothetical protein
MMYRHHIQTPKHNPASTSRTISYRLVYNSPFKRALRRIEIVSEWVEPGLLRIPVTRRRVVMTIAATGNAMSADNLQAIRYVETAVASLQRASDAASGDNPRRRVRGRG